MKGLFDPEANNLIKERINKLTAGSPPLWGKVNVSQMLAYLQPVMLVASGELKLNGGLVGLLFGRMARKQVLSKPRSRQLLKIKRILSLAN